MITLPDSYLASVKELFKEEYPAYLASFEKESLQGLRINTNKISSQDFLELSELDLKEVPWIHNGFYYEDAAPARHPHYYAGLYYLQEPSAMTPANRLPVEPGDCVLDLCAAPGGKATELGAKLKGKGFLLANDISTSRAQGLLKNLELAGIHNVCVTAENPERLKEEFPAFFDKILIDAPCSGEGMFRRNRAMISYWEKEGPETYAPIQATLLEQGYAMLKAGGMLLYSTCTFSELENEANIKAFLMKHPDMHTVAVEGYEGFTRGFDGLHDAVRILPHKMDGEGHFLVLLQKEGDRKPTPPKKEGIPFSGLPIEVQDFLAHTEFDFSKGSFLLERDQVYYLSEDVVRKKRIRYLRSGLLLGAFAKKRFEPSQAFAMALTGHAFSHVVDFKAEDEKVIRYLKGETVLHECQASKDRFSWRLITVDGYPLGWAKYTGTALKNKYAAGWRWQ